MDLLGRAYPAIIHEARHGDDWRAADAWRELHRRPDVGPLPVQPEHTGIVTRFRAILATRPRHATSGR